MTDEISSADPEALSAYVETGLRIAADREASATRLAGALAEFAATCREYALGIDASLADPLRGLAQRNVDHDLWVRRVAEQFVLADGGASAETTMGEMIAAGTDSEPLSVADWSVEQRIEYAIRRALAHLPEELRRQLEAVLTPATLAWMVGIMAVWLAGQFFGYGLLADGAVLVAGIVLLGPEAVRAGQELGLFVSGVAGSQTPDDLDIAGAHLATLVSIVGVDTLMAIVAHKVGGELNSAVPGSGPTLRVAPEGAAVGSGGRPFVIDNPFPGDPLAMQTTNPAGPAPVVQDTVAITQTYDALGEVPPRLNAEANDAALSQQGAHTLDAHGPDIPLRQVDAPLPGTRTIEGRIYGDQPWRVPENWSYRWKDSSTMNRTINAYVHANWEAIRSDLALTGAHDAIFDAGNAVGEGYYNASVGTSAPPQAVYHVTSMVRMTIKMVDVNGTPTMTIITAFPLGKGGP